MSEYKPTDLPENFETPDWIMSRVGEKVWVNGKSGLLGRYSPNGVDVHNETGNCIGCATGATSFQNFLDGMLVHHRIDLREIMQ